MKLNIDNIKFFVSVINSGTLTNAAQTLDIPKSTLSRHLQQLEIEMGLKLLRKQGRKLKPTEAGLRLFDQSENLIESLDQIVKGIEDFHHQPKGNLRIQAPVEFMMEDMAQLLTEFGLQYRDINICYTQYAADFNPQTGCDISILTHDLPLQDSDLIARPLMSLNQGLYCSPSYLNGKKTLTMDELSEMKLISQSNEPYWYFRQQQQRIALTLSDVQLMINSPTMRLIAAQRQLGITKLPSYLVSKQLREGSLIEVKTELPLWASNVSLVYSHRQPPRKIAVFVDFLQNNIGRFQSQI